MFDRFNRKIEYLRISVTDRCNLRCRYCMPEEGIQLLNHSEILTFDEIARFTKTAVANGITKVRITGGEPLVRKGIVTLVSMISSVKGIKDLSMTTNGMLLERFADELKKAGLQPLPNGRGSVFCATSCHISRPTNIPIRVHLCSSVVPTPYPHPATRRQ